MITKRKENTFEVEIDNYSFKAIRTDPFGFWSISGKHGKTYIPVEGEYTSTDEVELAIKKKITELQSQAVTKKVS